MCAFIVHKAEDKFIAHVFHCDPNAGPLCKTIEAACKVGFSRVISYHYANHRLILYVRFTAKYLFEMPEIVMFCLTRNSVVFVIRELCSMYFW